jgi:hypothetical protein
MGIKPGVATGQIALPPALVPWPSAQLKSTLMPIGPARATLPDATAHPKAEYAIFFTQSAFIPNLLPKMENQSFEKLLTVRRALFFKPFPYNNISFHLPLSKAARMRKSLETVYLAIQLPDTNTALSLSDDFQSNWPTAICRSRIQKVALTSPVGSCHISGVQDSSDAWQTM